MTAVSDPDRTTLEGLRSLVPAGAAAFAIVACALPILVHPHLPLVDLPNHIARLHVAASDLESGPLGRYYDYVLSPVPNSAADIAWHVLGHPGDPARFAQVIMAAYAVNLIVAAMVLGRVVHGRWTAWPAAAGMLAYSAPFLWGFQNFTFSLPFVLYGLALWIGTEGRRDALRLALMVPFACAIYLMHFFGFAILAIAVFGREAQIALTDQAVPMGRCLARGTVRMLPFMLPTAWLAYGILTGGETDKSSYTEYGSVSTALAGLVSPLFTHVNANATMTLAGLLGTAILCVAVVEMARRRGIVTLDERMIGPVLALGVAAVLAPYWLNGIAWVQIRVPVVLVLVLVAGSRLGALTPRQATLLAMAVSLVMVGRGAALERDAARQTQEAADIVLLGSLLDADARVLPLRAPGDRRALRSVHLQANLVIAHDIFIPTLFLGTHMLRVRDEWRDLTHYAAPTFTTELARDIALVPEAPRFMQDWPEKYTHVLLLDPPPTEIERELGLELVGAAGFMSLYAVLPDAVRVPAADSPFLELDVYRERFRK